MNYSVRSSYSCTTGIPLLVERHVDLHNGFTFKQWDPVIETASDRPKDILVAAGEYDAKRVVLRLSFLQSALPITVSAYFLKSLVGFLDLGRCLQVHRLCCFVVVFPVRA